ncbi:hypothetical protein [Streptomyces sp. NPDC046631]|uniref:hypothetical protein n=1 Tax=unclassified Streptomyces TaxID=2593676 RepID=UPI0033D3A107
MTEGAGRGAAMAVAAAAAVAVVVLGGCTAGTSGETAVPKPAGKGPTQSARPGGEVPDGDVPPVRLPIDAYALSDEGIALVARAGAKLTQDCMRGFSLRYEPPEVPQDAAATENRRYGISDASLAARYGYHLAPHPDTAPAGRLTAAQSMVLSGEKENGERAHTYNGKKIPEHGCAGQAAYQTRARYRAEDAAAVASDIDTRSFQTSLTDEKVGAAVKDWSACMKEKGLTYGSPLESVADRAFTGAGTASDKERAVAVADVNCKARTGLVARWMSAEAAIQRDLIQKNRAVLGKLEDAQRQELGFARQVLRD